MRRFLKHLSFAWDIYRRNWSRSSRHYYPDWITWRTAWEATDAAAKYL